MSWVANDLISFSRFNCLKKKSSIAVRCATDHPQQTLYQLLALSNAYADDPVTHKKTKEPRVLGAAKILEQLRKYPILKEVIVQMERMCSSKTMLKINFFVSKISKQNFLIYSPDHFS